MPPNTRKSVPDPEPVTPAPGGVSFTPTPEDNTPVMATAVRPVKPSPALFVNEGTRQDLLSGGRAFDFATGRELTLDGDTVRYATDAEIAERGRPATTVSTGDTASLNPS